MIVSEVHMHANQMVPPQPTVTSRNRQPLFLALLTVLALFITIPPAKSAETNSVSERTPAQMSETRAKAESGDPKAQFDLGECYYEGSGLEKDPL